MLALKYILFLVLFLVLIFAAVCWVWGTLFPRSFSRFATSKGRTPKELGRKTAFFGIGLITLILFILSGLVGSLIPPTEETRAANSVLSSPIPSSAEPTVNQKSKLLAPSTLPSSVPSPVKAEPAGYQWVDNRHGGVNYFSNGKPITREDFATGAGQNVAIIENWVYWVFTGHPNYQWADNNEGGVNYYVDGRPITRQSFQAGVRAQGDTRTNVDNIESWVKNIFDAKQSAASKTTPESTDLPVGKLDALGARTKSSRCIRNGALQDKACTPGAIFSVAAQQVCVSGYSSSVRNVSESTKNAVYAEYGIISHVTGEYEVDHLIPLELGGSNDISNLWPETSNPMPGFHQKDGLENSLHSKVCSGSMSLATAQLEISDNWLSVYTGTYVSSDYQPQTAPAAPAAVSSAAPVQPTSSGIVKKSSTGICHAPGTTYYDRTTNYTPYSTLDTCIASGGRLPLK